MTLGTPTSTSDWSLGDKKPQHPGWAHTTVGPRPGPSAPGRPLPPAARLPGLPGCPLRELEHGTGEHHKAARRVDALESGDYGGAGLGEEEEDLAERFTRCLLEDASGGY